MQTTSSFLRSILTVIGLAVLAAVAFLVFRGQVGRIAAQIESASNEQEPSMPTEQATEPEAAPAERTYEIVTLLPPDGIPAIDNPRFYSAAQADAEYDPDELVLGVTINGESKAYSTSHLDSHEIVNDTLGGRMIAVTW